MNLHKRIYTTLQNVLGGFAMNLHKSIFTTLQKVLLDNVSYHVYYNFSVKIVGHWVAFEFSALKAKIKGVLTDCNVTMVRESRERSSRCCGLALSHHRGPTQSVWVADCYFIVNVLDLPFASPIAIYR